MRRFRSSIRGLMAVTAVLALLLVPVVWVARERAQMLHARNEALRAVVLAERYRTALRDREKAQSPASGQAEPPDAAQPTPAGPNDASPVIERLQRENAELKATVQNLRSEVERLKARNR
jgi:hypothetical protein